MFLRWLARSLPMLLIVALLCPSTVEADEAAGQAKKLYQQAEVHFSVGEFGKALTLYREAYKTKRLAGFLFNIGQCERKLGRCKEALFYFRRYLIELPNAPNREVVEKLVQSCEQELARQKEKEEKEEKAQEPTTKPTIEKSSESETQRRRGLSPIWFWSSVGLAGALLVTGTVTGIVVLNMDSEYHDKSTSLARRKDLQETGEPLGMVSTATFLAGAVAAVAAGVLYFYTEWGSTETPTVTAGALPGGGGLTLQGRF